MRLFDYFSCDGGYGVICDNIKWYGYTEHTKKWDSSPNKGWDFEVWI